MRIMSIILFSFMLTLITPAFAKPSSVVPIEYTCHVTIQPTDYDADYFLCNVKDLAVLYKANTGTLYIIANSQIHFTASYFISGVFNGQIIPHTYVKQITFDQAVNFYLTTNGFDNRDGMMHSQDSMDVDAMNINSYGTGNVILNYTGDIKAYKTGADLNSSLVVNVDIFYSSYSINN